MAAADLLAECEEAISACLKSQAYTVAERSQQRAQLSQLQEMHKYLSELVQVGLVGGQMASVGQFESPT